MRIVVTGATGNLGTAVLRRLAPEHELVGLARRPPTGPEAGGVEWWSADLTLDASRPVLVQALAGADAVVHLAWAIQPTRRPDRLEQLGVGGTARVVAAAEASGVPHLVHLSSVGAYAPKQDDEPVTEGYPATGVPTSVYSRHKAAVESLLDRRAAAGSPLAVARMRPGIVGQRAAGSALLRYGLPGLVPAGLLGHLPVLPLDPRFRVPVVHADDVADAVARALERRAEGAFNLAADDVATAATVAAALRARLVPVPATVLRTVVAASWRVGLQPIDAGWLDLAFAVPGLDTGRARGELGWAPTRSAVEVLAETVDGMRTAASGPTAVLRPRSVSGALRTALRHGTVARRPRP